MKRPETITPSETAKKLNMLIYGGPGAGKTHLIGSAAKDSAFGKILLLCVDPGALTLADDPDANKNIQVSRITSLEDLEAWYDYLANDKTNEFQTVALDGFTDVAELALQEALVHINKMDSRRDINQPGVDHWGRVATDTRRVIRQFRDLDMYFIGTALAQDKTDSTGQVFTLPSVPGKLAGELGAYVDIIGYLYTEIDQSTKQVVRKLRTEPTGKIQAKSRSKKLPGVIENPTLGMINEFVTHGQVRDVSGIELTPKFKSGGGKK